MSFHNKYFIADVKGKWKVVRLELSEEKYDEVLFTCVTTTNIGSVLSINFPSQTVANIYLKR